MRSPELYSKWGLTKAQCNGIRDLLFPAGDPSGDNPRILFVFTVALHTVYSFCSYLLWAPLNYFLLLFGLTLYPQYCTLPVDSFIGLGNTFLKEYFARWLIEKALITAKATADGKGGGDYDHCYWLGRNDKPNPLFGVILKGCRIVGYDCLPNLAGCPQQAGSQQAWGVWQKDHYKFINCQV